MASRSTQPESLLIEKLAEVDKAMSPVLWQQMRADADLAESLDEADRMLPPALRVKKKMCLQDFVDKAVNLPLEMSPCVPAVIQQLYRLHLFCCQRVIHSPEVKHNPFRLGFQALEEMKMALVAMFISYTLIDPSAPHSWNRIFFESNIIPDKAADGHTIITFKKMPAHIIEAAITEEFVTDWLIYRAYDNNGIRTLMDYKNNLLTLPDYKRGGHPVSEFSRFQRKFMETRKRREVKQKESLELEYRKTLVQSVAQQTAAQMITSGMSAAAILEQAFSADLSKITVKTETVAAISGPSPQPQAIAAPAHQPQQRSLPAPNKPQKPKKNKEPLKSVMDDVIARLLEE